MSREQAYWQRVQARRVQRRTVLRAGGTVGGALVTASFLAACSSSSPKPTTVASATSGAATLAPNAPAGSASTAAAGGSPAAAAKPAAAPQLTSATLRVGIGSDAGSMDPQSLAGTGGGNWVNYQTHFDSPIYADPTTGSTYGNMLESFTVSADGMSWQAKLRAGITFHNGEAWDAPTLKANMERMLGAPSWDPSFASGLGAQFKGAVQSVEVVDTLTATFHMAQVDVAFPSKLAVPMLPLKYMQATDDATLAAKPVGSGPFQFVSRTPDSEIRSTRFDKYFRPQNGTQGPRIPYIKDLIQQVFPEDQARINALQAGNIDMAYNVPSDLAKSLQGQSGLKLAFLHGDQPMHIMINTRMQTDPDTGQPNPWLDARVRQAANMAVDLDTIIKTLLTGQEKRSFGSSSFSFGFPKDITQKQFKYDPNGAKALLTQAGFPNGFKALLNYPTGRWPNTEQVTQAIAGYLTKVGIQTTLQPLQYQVVTTKIKEGSLYPLVFFGMAGGNDPEPNFFDAYTDNSIYGEDTGGPAVTQLVLQQEAEPDPTKRAALIGQIITQFYTDARWVFLYEPITVVAMSNKWAYDPYFQPAAFIDYWNVRPVS